MGAWGRMCLRTTPELAAPNKLLAEGGPELQEALMDELRELHLGKPYLRRGKRPSVLIREACEPALMDQSE